MQNSSDMETDQQAKDQIKNDGLVIGLVPSSESKSISNRSHIHSHVETTLQIKQGPAATDELANNVTLDESLVYSIDKIKTKDGIEIKPKKSELA